MITDCHAGPVPDCIAGVLAGGQGRRMGRPKANVEFSGAQTLLAHVVRVATTVVQSVVVLGGDASWLPPQARPLFLPDEYFDRGPLSGLCSLLRYCRQEWGLLLACDMPCLRAGVLYRLLAAARSDVDAVAFLLDQSRGVYHTCCALYHPRLLRHALHELNAGRRCLHRVLSGARVATILPDVDERRQLTNVNTLEDLGQVMLSLGTGADAPPSSIGTPRDYAIDRRHSASRD